MERDAAAILDEAPMRWPQIAVVALCILLNALDGFDVLAISFASPGIAAEWRIDRAALGIVLSMELIGMAAGSIILGSLADRIGRRPTINICLCIMAIGMAAATQAHDVVSLSLYRLLTGLGIGGMLASTNAMVAEFANRRSRSLAVALMAAGYPVGAIFGGTFASMLLVDGDWRHIFLFGAAMTIMFLPLTWFFLPESIGFLNQRRPANALERANAVLRRMGHPPADALSAPTDLAGPSSFRVLFAPGLASTTLLLTCAYFFHIMTFYFMLKWIPKIVVDMGYAPSPAGGVLVWANVGGLLGAVLLSVLSWRFSTRTLVIVALLSSTAFVILFGQVRTDIAGLATISAAAGFFTNAAVVGLYAIIAAAFPTAVRASGTGFVIGLGRGGAALGPIVAGYLFSMDLGLNLVAIVMACGSLIGAFALYRLADTPHARLTMPK